MIIDGKALSETILTTLARQTATLKKHDVTPTLAVILVGDNPASLAYIKQKQKAAERIGAKLELRAESAEISKSKLQELITSYNHNPNIHGLIVQRPVPAHLSPILIYEKIKKEKDVDGFLTESPFEVPVALAVGEMLKFVYTSDSKIEKQPDRSTPSTEYMDWLRTKKIVVIGRGDTAGAPIHHYFNKLQCATSQIHSQTPNPNEVLQKADIIISCVGKERVVTKEQISPGAILISVGIWRNAAGKLHGDYDESDIADIASWYTPTPGGVGPVNVACLMQNLVKAARNTH